jgi:hypothetical protein
MRRDEERINEEIAGVVRPGRPRSLSGAYLSQAVDALSDAGNPAALYRHWRERWPDDRKLQLTVLNAVQMEHVAMCRTAVLFAALAAESYVNEFLAVHLDDEEFRKREKRPTVEKYEKWTARAYGQVIFIPGRGHLEEIAALFNVRDRLVHPKPGFGAASLLEPSDEFRELFAPTKAASYIVTVGGAASVLMRRAYGFDHVDDVAEPVWQGREAIEEYARRITTLPAHDASAEPPLYAQAWERAVAKQKASGLADIPDLSINRLRRAKEERRRRETRPETPE